MNNISRLIHNILLRLITLNSYTTTIRVYNQYPEYNI